MTSTDAAVAGPAPSAAEIAGDAARLVAYGLRTRTRPGSDSEYAELVVRHLAEPSFASTTRAVAGGYGLSVLSVDRIEGIVLTPVDDDSPFRMRLADYVAVPNADTRLMHGLVQLAIAATAYPTAAALEDDQRLASVTVQQVYDRIRHIIDDARVGGDADPPEDAPELEPLWRLIARQRAADTTPDGRQSTFSVNGAITKAFRWLEDNGMADPVRGEEATWRLRDRYRIQVLGAAADTIERFAAPTGEPQ